MIISSKKPLIIFVFDLLAGVQLSSSSSIENELLLAARYDGLQTKLDQVLVQLGEEKLHRTNLQALNERLESKIDFLMTESTKQDEEIRLLKNRNCGENVIQPKPHENSTIMDDVKIDSSSLSPKLPPSSCRQLSTIGHYLDGIYLVANQDTNKIETVYCDFGTTITETLYGNVDVKIKSVHFFVQRSSDFSLTNTVLPFDIERLNVGGAMNLETGVFTVPVDGIYHFEFSAGKKASDANDIYVYLQLNGVTIGAAYATNISNFLSLNGIIASLRLKIGDKVRLYKTNGATLYGVLHTHFTGWLVEEDLALGI